MRHGVGILGAAVAALVVSIIVVRLNNGLAAGGSGILNTVLGK